jgi:F0F1-type ATP synthase alpha subunit
VDLTSRMPKTPLIRELNSEQLLSGHIRIDLLQPMTKGNFILMKGNRSVGKTTMTESIIKKFLAEDSESKVVYVGMSTKGKEISEHIQSDRLMTFGVSEDSSASYYLAPHLALKVAVEEKKVLFILDDALLHQTKERSIFDLAE